jgi:hypothetical protein
MNADRCSRRDQKREFGRLIIRWTDYRRSSALIGGKKILLWSIHHQRSPSQRLKCNSPVVGLWNTDIALPVGAARPTFPLLDSDEGTSWNALHSGFDVVRIDHSLSIALKPGDGAWRYDSDY